ncbi:MAG: OmpH family outer membrane protein [Treponema porcinum]|uniref:OmpH family outer membrane protein n=1 Tax=Treponema TaxID=157 RepID=UPI0023541CD5|nr:MULTISPECIES: OmpH family outer membrane protein [Treponema]MCI5644096.1 OmpH family outer membrane protein [Treponema porcinum]MDD6899460.1 OmpH family outer membrane protein [Treponema porcinum]MDY5049127.1 OmpH family outer membrane protein [Treponema porcinum]
MKKRFFALIGVLFFMAAGSGLYAQQITKFGVVDTAKVYNAYFRNSAPVRNYEKKKSEFQEEINKYTDELQKLQLKKLEYEKADNDAQAQRVQAEISKKSEFLVEYTNAKNIELESIQKSLQSSDAFYKKLYESLAKIAESGGYSMILSLQQANAILWYSSSVDITEQVIADLGL